MPKPTIPQGTRDFGADVVHKRNFIFTTIKNVFELYGFQPLETPAMENLDTLMGKYGDEGDKLIFKILNNGLDNPAKHEQAKEDFEKILEGKSIKGLTERALRYDLTIPFARYVAMNHGQLTFPYKRYQMQPVWRADRPQRGRYREFYQCDADVVGSTSLINEIEFVHIYNDVFIKLGIENVQISINNRKILMALAEVCGGTHKMMDITIAIDKLDKIGIDKVKEELVQKELTGDQMVIIEKYLTASGKNEEKLNALNQLLGENEYAQKGLAEIEFILKHTKNISNINVDFTLARGLNYYTGIIFEVKAPAQIKMGSIGGGGRYDDLTGLFEVPDIPGVGISFGVDRIYDVIEEMNLFPDKVYSGTRVLFFNLGQTESDIALKLLPQLRKQRISCELYHEKAKFDKQFKYAEKKSIPYIVIIGTKEMEENNCIIKNLSTGKQESIPQNDLENYPFE
ncbi:MAG: histidine--tRNA ligase [Chitinophagaceae bacterium]|jgi:histidyl-tRNA synthetase|nr:histidine--tRNA ligase [Chitinophagaceae bacterium]